MSRAKDGLFSTEKKRAIKYLITGGTNESRDEFYRKLQNKYSGNWAFFKNNDSDGIAVTFYDGKISEDPTLIEINLSNPAPSPVK